MEIQMEIEIDEFISGLYPKTFFYVYVNMTLF